MNAEAETWKLAFRWGCALYRYYGPAEELLYTGISADPNRRWQEHVRDWSADPESKPWVPQAVRRVDEWYLNEEEAEEAERQAIASEAPIWNKVRKTPDVCGCGYIRFRNGSERAAFK